MKTTTTTTVSPATTTGSPGPESQLVDDAQTVSTDLSTLTTDQGAFEQLAQSVSSETTAIEQDDGCALSSETMSNARALDGAAQTVQNDYNQLNSDEATYRTLELTEPSRAPTTAPSFLGAGRLDLSKWRSHRSWVCRGMVNTATARC